MMQSVASFERLKNLVDSGRVSPSDTTEVFGDITCIRIRHDHRNNILTLYTCVGRYNSSRACVFMVSQSNLYKLEIKVYLHRDKFGKYMTMSMLLTDGVSKTELFCQHLQKICVTNSGAPNEERTYDDRALCVWNECVSHLPDYLKNLISLTLTDKEKVFSDTMMTSDWVEVYDARRHYSSDDSISDE